MNTNNPDSGIFDEIIGKEADICLKRRLLSANTTFSGIISIKSKILNVYSQFILIQQKEKRILINKDNITGIEYS